MSQQHQREAADRVMPGMRDHSCSKSSPQQREHAKHGSIGGDQQYSGDSFIPVRTAKHQRGERDADPHPAPHARKLLLKVTAEDQFLADAGRDAQYQEQHHLHRRDRRELLGHVTDFPRVNVRSRDSHQHVAQESEGKECSRPVAERKTKIDQPRPGAGSLLAQQLPQGNLAHVQAPQNQAGQKPFIRDGQTVVRHQMEGLIAEVAQLPDSGHRKPDDHQYHQCGVPPRRQQAAVLVRSPANRLRRFHRRHVIVFRCLGI